MDSRQLYLILRARWKSALFLFACVIFLAALVTLLMPKMYTATASLVVEARADPLANTAYPQQVLASDIATQVDIIKSRRVATRVVTNLKLDQAPDFRELWVTEGSHGKFAEWLCDYLLKQLVVTPAKDSNVIQIAMSWRDAKTAATLANAFAQAYIQTNIELKVDSAKQYASLFDEQSRALRADLEAKQKRLADYQNRSGIVATDEKLDVENARLSELSTQLVAIQAQREESQSRQRQASGDTESLPEVLQSRVIENLKADLATAEAKRQEIAQTLGKNYPDYKDVVAEIAGLRERIAQESTRIAASLGDTAQVDLRRENDLKAALQAQKERILGLNQQRAQVIDLQNDVTTARHNLDAVTARLAQSSLESQARQTNVALLAPAIEPLRPSSPRYLLNMLLACVVGVVIAVGATLLSEMADSRVRQSEELVPLLGIPLIGRIPDTTAEVRRSFATYRAPAMKPRTS
ncbi:MAG TPA: chain length determinant protein EpsF [Bradyrhizobium sp.]|nr:chain length determinant protein EpsF [Bradyrhizobium sp.]